MHRLHTLIDSSKEELRRHGLGTLAPPPTSGIEECVSVEDCLCHLPPAAIEPLLTELKRIALASHKRTGCPCGHQLPGPKLFEWLYGTPEPWTVPLSSADKDAQESFCKRGSRMKADWGYMTLATAKILFLLRFTKAPGECVLLSPPDADATQEILQSLTTAAAGASSSLLAAETMCTAVLRAKGIQVETGLSRMFRLATDGQFTPGLGRFKKAPGKYSCGLCLHTFACPGAANKHVRTSTRHRELADLFLGVNTPTPEAVDAGQGPPQKRTRQSPEPDRCQPGKDSGTSGGEYDRGDPKSTTETTSGSIKPSAEHSSEKRGPSAGMQSVTSSEDALPLPTPNNSQTHADSLGLSNTARTVVTTCGSAQHDLARLLIMQTRAGEVAPMHTALQQQANVAVGWDPAKQACVSKRAKQIVLQARNLANRENQPQSVVCALQPNGISAAVCHANRPLTGCPSTELAKGASQRRAALSRLQERLASLQETVECLQRSEYSTVLLDTAQIQESIARADDLLSMEQHQVTVENLNTVVNVADALHNPLVELKAKQLRRVTWSQRLTQFSPKATGISKAADAGTSQCKDPLDLHAQGCLATGTASEEEATAKADHDVSTATEPSKGGDDVTEDQRTAASEMDRSHTSWGGNVEQKDENAKESGSDRAKGMKAQRTAASEREARTARSHAQSGEHVERKVENEKECERGEGKAADADTASREAVHGLLCLASSTGREGEAAGRAEHEVAQIVGVESGEQPEYPNRFWQRPLQDPLEPSPSDWEVAEVLVRTQVRCLLALNLVCSAA